MMIKDKFSPQDYEAKWMQKWFDEQLYKKQDLNADENSEKFYSLYSFPYPSGSGLHVGHVEGMVANDIPARFERMRGKKVLLPMGWDSFGLPAENYAIKTGIHPNESTEEIIKNFIKQIQGLGISVDWDTEVGAHWPSYYKWTQWIFLQLFKNGLAYRKTAPVNWCPKDQTVLANEQVIDGRCERCDTEVVQKDMEQWFFKITDFAERLDNDLDSVDWPASTKSVQRNWIGKSEGAIVKFDLKNAKLETSDEETLVEVFTTRVDTIFGAAYIVMAPEHPLLKEGVLRITNTEEVEKYIEATKSKTDLERQTSQEKTGVKLEGISAINPANGEELPVYISDFVIGTYGTGAIFGDAHDERDFEFALKFKIPLKSTIIPPDGNVYMGYVARKWSNDFDKFVANLETIEASFSERTDDKVLFSIGEKYLPKFIDFAKESVKGKNAWHDVVGREAVVIFGDGESYSIPKFIDDELVWDKMCQLEEGVREFSSLWEMYYNSDYKSIVCNTEDGVLYASAGFDGLTSEEARQAIARWLEEKDAGFAKTTFRIRDWLVSRQRYWGCPIPIVYDPEGIAHPVDEGDLPLLLPTDVDFKPTGESPIKRSKEFKKRAEERYGKGWYYEADTMDTFVDSSWYFFRHVDAQNEDAFASTEKMNAWLPVDLYMIGSEHTVLHLLYSRFFTKFFYDQGLISFDEPFKKLRHMGLVLGSDGRKMSKRWGNVINPTDEIQKYGADTVRIYEMFMGPLEVQKPWNDRSQNGVFRFLNKVWDLQDKVNDSQSSEQSSEVNKLQKKITEDIETMSFNTAVAKFMEFTNFLTKEEHVNRKIWETFLLLLAPFAPFITEELWSRLGNSYSIHQQKWPDYDETLVSEQSVTLAVQVNGKHRANITVPFDSTEDAVKDRALEETNVKKYVVGEPQKVIFVKNRIINFIV